MKLFCYNTPSHDVFYDEWFTKSIQDEFELVRVRDDSQHCKSARYRQHGWRETQIRKVRLWLRALREEEVFVGSDVDIQWFGPTSHLLQQCIQDRDFAVQSYGDGAICSGFFICRSNARTQEMWQTVLEGLEKGESQGEEDLLRNCLRNKMVKWAELPRNVFWTPNNLYREHSEFKVPRGLLMHHATFVVGIDNKLKQMRHVRKTITGSPDPI